MHGYLRDIAIYNIYGKKIEAPDTRPSVTLWKVKLKMVLAYRKSKHCL